MSIRVSKNFSSSKYNDSGLVIFSQQVTGKIDGNVHFPTPIPSIEEINTAITDFDDSLKLMKEGTKADTVIKNRKRKLLEELLKKEAQYVEDISNGDLAIILTSGFEVTKTRGTIGELDIPGNLSLTIGNSKGTLLAKFDSVDHARFYELEIIKTSTNGDAISQKFTSTKTKYLFENLISGVEYAVRVAAAGSGPQRLWSKWVTSFVI